MSNEVDSNRTLPHKTICTHLVEKFELTFLKEKVLKEATRFALERFQRKFRRERFDEKSEIDRILLSREFLKILSGVTLFEDGLRVLAANDKVATKRRFDDSVEALLKPQADALDPAAYLSPLAWDARDESARNADEAILRLTCFVAGMLDQEDGFEDAGIFLPDAVKIEVEARTAEAKPRPKGGDKLEEGDRTGERVPVYAAEPPPKAAKLIAAPPKEPAIRRG